MFPSSGGTYIYTSRLLNPTLGVLAAFWMLLAGIGAIGMLALGFVDYMSFYFANLPILPTAIGTVLIFLIINLFGIRFSSLLQIFMVIWMVIALVIFIVFGLLGQGSGEFVAVDNGPFLRNGIGGLFLAAVLSFYSYAGYGLITEIGGEIKNPQKNTPRAIIISLVFVTIIYMGVAYVSTTIIPIEEFVGFSASLPMAAILFLPQWTVNIIAIGGLFAIFTSLNAILLVIPQELYIMGKDGTVSKLFTIRHKKFDTPYVPLILVGILTIVLILLGTPETVFATMTVAGLLLGGSLMGLAALQIFRKTPHLYEKSAVKIPKPLLITFSILGIISSLIFTLLAMLDAPIVGVMVLAVAIFSIVYSHLHIKSQNISELHFDEDMQQAE